MKNDILKTLAMRAKNRLLSKGLRDTYSNANIKIIDTNDSEFVNKVKEIMDMDFVQNPIKLLMDENAMLSMDDMAKERYLLDTVEKYSKARLMLEKSKVC